MDFNFFPSHKFTIIYPELFVASKTGKYSLFELAKKLCHVHMEPTLLSITILKVYFITSPSNIDCMIHITGEFLANEIWINLKIKA